MNEKACVPLEPSAAVIKVLHSDCKLVEAVRVIGNIYCNILVNHVTTYRGLFLLHGQNDLLPPRTCSYHGFERIINSTEQVTVPLEQGNHVSQAIIIFSLFIRC